MTYTVREIYYTLQGEGGNVGRAAVFLRFAGCNLWSGREQDRARAICQFCDTEFRGTGGPGGGKFTTPEALADAVAQAWLPAVRHPVNSPAPEFRRFPTFPLTFPPTHPHPHPHTFPHTFPHLQVGEEAPPGWVDRSSRLVVCTGGEPLLQLDEPLIQALKERSFEVAVETNGTLVAPSSIDWVCVSPKADAPLKQLTGDELKLVYPQPGAMPEDFAHLEFKQFLLQPMDGPDLEANTRAAVEYCLTHPQWRFSLQTHKVLRIA